MSQNADAACAAVRCIADRLRTDYPQARVPSDTFEKIQHWDAGGIIALCKIALQRKMCGTPQAILPNLLYLLQGGFQVNGQPNPEHVDAWPPSEIESFLKKFDFTEAAWYDILAKSKERPFFLEKPKHRHH